MPEPGPHPYQVAWNLFTELRKETVESQRIRAQIIGVKITFISAGMGVIAANLNNFPSEVFVIPAFAAMFFDLLIASYSFSIKRIGHYCHTHLEPRIRESCSIPGDFLLWQEFIRQPKMRQNLGDLANLGMTFLVLAAALLALLSSIHPIAAVALGGALVALFVCDYCAQFSRWRFEDERSPQTKAARP